MGRDSKNHTPTLDIEPIKLSHAVCVFFVCFKGKCKRKSLENSVFSRDSHTCARGFEPPTPWSVAKCSIQLSYAHIFN